MFIGDLRLPDRRWAIRTTLTDTRIDAPPRTDPPGRE